MAGQLDIPLIFYGDAPGDYGRKVTQNVKMVSIDEPIKSQKGFDLDPLKNKKFNDVYLGGKKVQEYLDEGLSLNDLLSYMPLDPQISKDKKLQFHFFGYYLRFVPQENFYFATEKTDFMPNPVRTEGTYQKYQSIDDKLDGFFFYTRYIKFSVGRTMMDSAMEIRNGHITKKEGLDLIKKFDGEYPAKYEKEFCDYIGIKKEELSNLIDKFRPEHIWTKRSNHWILKNSCEDYFKNL